MLMQPLEPRTDQDRSSLHERGAGWYAPNYAGLDAIPVAARAVRDGKFLSSSGVSAGIDSALTLAADLMGPEAAQSIQLSIQ